MLPGKSLAADPGPHAFVLRRSSARQLLPTSVFRCASKGSRSVLRGFCKRMAKFVKSESGPTAVEYAAMLALIVVVCLASIQVLGRNANSAYNTVGKSVGKTVSS